MEFVVPGFQAAAVAAGLKPDGQDDLALIVSQTPAAAAGVFTQNKVRAAPVLISQSHLRDGSAQAIVANAGNANACTGEPGLAHARLMAEQVAGRLDIPAEQVLVASTGVIGQPLAIDRVEAAIPGLVRAVGGEKVPAAARAIMTTDSFPKLSRYDGEAGGREKRPCSNRASTRFSII